MGHLIASRRSGRQLLLAGVALAALTGCGGGDSPTTQPTASAVLECRAEWTSLNSDWESRAESAFPSDLAARWTALAAGGAYQSATAADDCQDQLQDARLTARAIERLSGYLRPYDLVWQYGDVNPVAADWIADAKPKPAKRAQRALDKLERLAPEAMADMEAVWQAAVQTDLTDPEAMREFADSMDFVANDSVPWRQGSAALEQLRRLVSRR